MTPRVRRVKVPPNAMANAEPNPRPQNPTDALEFTGTYQPKRGPVAKVIAVLILVFLILVPSLLVLLTISEWGEGRPPPPPVAPSAGGA